MSWLFWVFNIGIIRKIVNMLTWMPWKNCRAHWCMLHAKYCKACLSLSLWLKTQLEHQHHLFILYLCRTNVWLKIICLCANKAIPVCFSAVLSIIFDENCELQLCLAELSWHKIFRYVFRFVFSLDCTNPKHSDKQPEMHLVYVRSLIYQSAIITQVQTLSILANISLGYQQCLCFYTQTKHDIHPPGSYRYIKNTILYILTLTQTVLPSPLQVLVDAPCSNDRSWLYSCSSQQGEQRLLERSRLPALQAQLLR